MSNHDNKSVSYAVLPTPLFVPRVGQIKGTLTNYHDGLNKGYRMTICEPFLSVETKDEVGKNVNILIPLSSLTHLVVGE